MNTRLLPESSTCSPLWALALFAGFCAPTEAAYLTRQLTSSTDKVEDHIRISGSRAVWQRKFSTNYEIYAYDGSSVLQLTNNGTDDSEPEISGNRLVYLNGTDVVAYHFDTGATTNLSNDAGWKGDPRIDGDWVYWFEWDAVESNRELVPFPRRPKQAGEPDKARARLTASADEWKVPNMVSSRHHEEAIPQDPVRLSQSERPNPRRL